MKNSVLIMAAFLLLSIGSAAQQLDLSYHQSVNAFANKLIDRHIDSIFVYEKYNENKNPMHTQYVIWKEKNHSYINKFDENNSYPTVEIKCDDFWKKMLTDIAVIKSETVEPFGYVAKANGQDMTFTSVSNATEVRQFKIYLNGDITSAWYNSFDFLEQATIKNEIRKNIYFERNTNLIGRQITNMLDAILADLEKK